MTEGKMGGWGNTLGMPFQFSTKQWYAMCTHKNRLVEAILMRTHSIHFHYNIKIPIISLNICFLELSEEFPTNSNTSSNQPR